MPFIAMEFVEGQLLRDRVKQGPLDISSVVAIAVQVADALGAAHSARIAHRDIKPENISLNERGGAPVGRIRGPHGRDSRPPAYPGRASPRDPPIPVEVVAWTY